MTLSLPGLAGALLFLILGLIELAVFTRAVRPTLVLRHEWRKVTQTQGRSPDLIGHVVRIQSLLIMPLVGYLVGQSSFSSMGAN